MSRDEVEGRVRTVCLVILATLAVGATLRQRYPDRRVYLVTEHNDLMNNTRYQTKLMGIKPVQLAPLNPLSAGWTCAACR